MPFNLQRFRSHLSARVDQAASEELLAGCEAYDALTTPLQRARWIKDMMERLEHQVGESLARDVMEHCGRQCISRGTLQRAAGYKRAAQDLDDLLDRLNQAHIGGGKLRRDGDLIHGSYDRCYCGSVSKTKEPIPATYCHCSCGWYKELFETLLEQPVEVELVASIVQGADACEFVIRI